MSKGIIYIMTTAVPGLIKIGKTGSTNFEQRMYNLEHDGYRNVTALKRSFAIEVDDYDEKEAMLHTIFEKSRVSDTELFALDVNIVTQLLSSFDGVVRCPYTAPELVKRIFVQPRRLANDITCFVPSIAAASILPSAAAGSRTAAA